MKKIFYGWINVGACIALMLVILGLGNATFSLFVKPISDNLGISRTSVSAIISFMALTGGVTSMMYGTLVKKVGMKWLMIIGVITSSLGYVLYSFSNNIIVFYLVAIMIGLGVVFLTTVPISTIIQKWFIKRRGFVLGLVFAASGVGGMIFNPIMSRLIVNNGWRFAYRIEAIIILAVALPAALLISINPKDKGTVAYGSKISNREVKNKEITGLTIKEARKTTSFKLIIITIICFTMGIHPILYNAHSYLTDVGFDLSFGASVMAIIYIVNAIAKIGLGIINDKFGLKSVLIIGFLSFIISDIFLLTTKTLPSAYLFGLFYGISISMMTIPLPLIIIELFGEKDYSSIMGVSMGALTIGIAIGVPLCTASYDKLGSYVPAFIVEGILVAIALVVSFIAIKLKPKY